MTAVEMEQQEDVKAGEIVRWRFDTLSRVGYAPPDAMDVATRLDIDLHVAVDLVDHGCPVETALRILL
jgi:hypothetical protein